MNIAVLSSEKGTTLNALLHEEQKIAPASVVLVITTKPHASIIKKVKHFNKQAIVIDNNDYSTTHEFETMLQQTLSEHHIDIVVLAGFMTILSSNFVSQWKKRIINIHPSLLPLFPGLNAPQQAIQSGAAISGCTVHFVDHTIDQGPVLAQTTVPIKHNDTPASLHQRIQHEEKNLLIQCIKTLALGAL